MSDLEIRPTDDDVPSSGHRLLKSRPDGTSNLFAVDLSTSMNVIDATWRPVWAEQAISRVRRTKNSTSRNEREGVYAFKVKGRHTRKRRLVQIYELSMSDVGMYRLDRRSKDGEF